MTPSKVAVTGGAGQLGTVVIRRLLADPRIEEVRCIDRRQPILVDPRLRPVIADIRDPDFDRHLEGCGALFHLAFVVTEWLPREEFDAVNIGGTRNVVEAAAAAGVRHIIYSSSMAAYGVVPGHVLPLTESSPRRLQPEFAYASAKYRIEEMLDEFERLHPEIAVVRLRPPVLFGKRMDNALSNLLRRGYVLELGHSPQPLVWDEDVAEAAWLALTRSARGAFILCAEGAVGARDMARIAGLRPVRMPRALMGAILRIGLALARARKRPAVDPFWIRAGRAPLLASSEHARRELGWQPSCPTAEAVVARFAATVPRRLDPRLARFFRLAGRAARRQPLPEGAAQVAGAIHLELGGPHGGDLTLAVADGHATIARGVPRPPAAIVRMSAETFLSLLAGTGGFASEQAAGRIELEGDAAAAVDVQDLIRAHAQNFLDQSRSALPMPRSP
jgi:UDP-glucose 4-epimerase